MSRKLHESLLAWEEDLTAGNEQLGRVLGAVINHKKGERTMATSFPIRWVYISGPYTKGDSVENTHAMTKAWLELQTRYPDIVFINPLVGSMATHLIEPQEYEFWLKYDLDLIRLLNRSGRGIIFRFRPGYESSGADREIELARTLGISVLYGGVEELAIVLDEIMGQPTLECECGPDPIWLDRPDGTGKICKTCGRSPSRQGIDSPASNPSSDEPDAIAPQTAEVTTSETSEGVERVGDAVRVDFSPLARREARDRLLDLEKVVNGGDGMQIDDYQRVKAARAWASDLVSRLDD